MKVGWTTRRLEEVCQMITDGSHFSPKTTDDGFPYVTVRDIEKGKIDFGNCKLICETDYKQLARNGCKPERGDILFSKDGTVGKAVLIDGDEDFVVLSSLAIVRADGRHLDPAFLKYVMQSPSFLHEAIKKKTGAAIRRIILRDLKSIPVPVPPMQEQKRIVSILDQVLADIAVAKANTAKNLQNARALFESYLRRVFETNNDDQVELRLSQVAKRFGRGRSKHRPRNDPRLYGGKYPFVQTGDVRNSDHLITSYSQTYNEVGLAQSRLWPAGTLCITIAANIAETGILSFEACFPDSIIGVVVDETRTSSKFLEYLLQSYKAHLKAQGKGSAQDNINLGTFENQLFPFPSLDAQKAIVSTLDRLREETRRLESLYQRKHSALDELERSFMQQAYSGDL